MTVVLTAVLTSVLVAAVCVGAVAGGAINVGAINAGEMTNAGVSRAEDPNARTGLAQWIWIGAVTADAVTIKARFTGVHERVFLAVGAEPTLADPRYSARGVISAENYHIAAFTVDGLTPDTQYYYAFERQGALDWSTHGSFRTFGQGPFSYEFAFAGDASTGSDVPVFGAVRDESPLFFLSPGDFVYSDISANQTGLYVDAMSQALSAPRQAALYRNTPLIYMWDDHDYGLNNSDSTSSSREAARLAYQLMVPHYPLPAGPAAPYCPYGTGAACRTVNHAFAVGRTYFIMTDLRSERMPNDFHDAWGKSMMGEVQKSWLKQQLLFARDHYALIFWVNTVPWIADAVPGDDSLVDTWASYTAERRQLADFIADNGIHNLVILAADAHMLALDDGTHSDYAQGGAAAMPVFHAAPLDRDGTVKGGPYSHGIFVNDQTEDGQYAVVSVTDDGGPEICVAYAGKRLYANTTTPVTLLTWAHCFPLESAATATPIPREELDQHIYLPYTRLK